MPAVHDAVVIGGGHNGLVAAALLGQAGYSVIVLERCEQVGGAAISGSPFPGVNVRASRYSYLVSLFPAALLRSLGVDVELRRRRIASYTPVGDSGLLMAPDPEVTRASVIRAGIDPRELDAWTRFDALTRRVAEAVFPTLTEPLRSRDELRRLIGDDRLWQSLFEEPLSAWLERAFSSDVVRGLVLTDATIGTFAAPDDPSLRQNRCFLYHVIGNGTGRWDVPVGGMGALSDALSACAQRAGVEIRTRAEVVSLATDGNVVEVACADGGRVQARHALVNAAPAVLSELLGDPPSEPAPEGSQLKLNMLLDRLPRLLDREVANADAFAGTFHVNEGYEQQRQAFAEAAAGRIPELPPCELYCHSLTDPSVLPAAQRLAGVQTLTLFGLHMPARLFSDSEARPATQSKREAVQATLRSVNSVLAEPLEHCLARDGTGAPCIEAVTPLDLEAELRMPGGHIFHRDLAWPFAEREDEIGSWGVETEHPNIWLCGAGARRGGAVSGIPGHNAAQAVLAAR
jgi:phytoene dehydrogenase-like protein